jgi:3-oxoacyl-[acyl-carrier-protein] synthase-3
MEAIVETSDAWIRERTGIEQAPYRRRRRAHLGSGRGSARARRSPMPGIDADQVDLIVVATATPDLTFPATATIIQDKLGITRAAPLTCTPCVPAFLYALATADNFIRTGQAKTALVIGAETFSRILDWTDRTTCVLFGDGAGAMVLTAEEGEPAEFKGF